jgi:predicted nucleic acid-binding protein
MIFWDASAVIPLCIEEPATAGLRSVLEAEGEMVAWWGTEVECCSALARLRREGVISTHSEDQAKSVLNAAARTWTEIRPGNEVRSIAIRLLLAHPLRAADSLQLAAAIVWAGKSPKNHRFACLDRRLRTAARSEGFQLVPEEFAE